MARTKRRSGISLPWERRGSLRSLLAGARWRLWLAAAVVVAIVWTIASAASRREKEHETRVAIAEVRRAIRAFRAETGRCPSSTVELVHPGRSSGRRYLRQMPKDGWGRSLWVRCPGRNDPDGADVISAGPSGSFFVDDNLW